MNSAPDAISDPSIAALQRYKPYLSAEAYQALLTTIHEPAQIALRINLLKNENPARALEKWSGLYGWETCPLSFYSDGFQFKHYDTPPSQTIEHRLGYYYLQDAASMLPAALFSPASAQSLTLDMAASPGGKTTQLVDNSGDHNLVVANDASASRLPALKVVLQTWGALNTVITNYPGEKWGPWFPETFDRVLLDAPCSMESLRTSPSHPHRPITPDERSRLAARQLALLESAVAATRTGGEIVYSTCTLAPEEDEAVLDAFLKAYPGVIQIDPTLSNTLQAPGLTHFAGKAFDPQVAGSLRLWPHLMGTNGFFAAHLIKISPMPTIEVKQPSREFVNTGLCRLPTALTKQLCKQVQDLYAFNLEAVLSEYQCALYQRGTQIWLIPEQYLHRFSSLPYAFLGFPLGKLIGSKLEISFEMVSRFGDTFSANIIVLPDEYYQDWLSGADLRGLPLEGVKMGTVVAVRDRLGRSLGAGKALPKRLRNLLPSRSLLSN
jgi:16S rRNA (cytosine1407-C5)-methyltransferase